MIRRLLIALLLAGLAGAASAQLRLIPADAKRGVMAPMDPPQPMVVELNGKPVELSAGAQIRDGRNMIILPTALPNARATVRYLPSQDGKLQRVWMLTPEEAAQPDPKK
jgi:hypothetical protein